MHRSSRERLRSQGLWSLLQADHKLERARNPQSLRHPPRGGVTAAGTLAEREPQRPPHTHTVGVVAARKIARSERALTPQQSESLLCTPHTKSGCGKSTIVNLIQRLYDGRWLVASHVLSEKDFVKSGQPIYLAPVILHGDTHVRCEFTSSYGHYLSMVK